MSIPNLRLSVSGSHSPTLGKVIFHFSLSASADLSEPKRYNNYNDDLYVEPRSCKPNCMSGFTFGSQIGYTCLVVHRRDGHVIEIQMGKLDAFIVIKKSLNLNKALSAGRLIVMQVSGNTQ